MTSREIYEAVWSERQRQERLKDEGKFEKTCADNMPDTERLAVLAEEFGEVARAVLERSRLANDVTGANLRDELIQVAAVCVAWLEGMS